MNVQSFSIVVPNKECVNKCPFCVSRMVNSNTYPNKMDPNDPHYDINVQEYMKRMKFVAGTGCQTVMLTGTSEPQQNKQFLLQWALFHKLIGSPFSNIEMQTTGALLQNHDYIRFLRNFVGVNVMALSINSLSDYANNKILNHAPNCDVNLSELCSLLREYDFNIRMCFNLSKYFNSVTTQDMFDFAKKNGASQVTFRKLYTSDGSTPQGKWISENAFSDNGLVSLRDFLHSHKIIGSTAYGALIYDVDGMSVIYDNDCMGKNPTGDTIKYLILRPNCKLYSSWDTKASLVF